MNFMSEETKNINSVPNPAYTIVDGVVNDPVDHPSHYTQYPVEVIELTRHMSFTRGNTVKYVARAGFKGDKKQELEDMKKARWYLNDDIARLEKELGK